MSARIDPARIEAAAARVDPVFADSPRLVAGELSSQLGLELVVKVETLNPIRSFKGRGPGELVHRLEDDGEALVSASAGNFGQGLAYAGVRAGRAVHIFSATAANPYKVARMRALGAEVHLEGEDFDAAKDAARAFAAAGHGRWVEDGDDVAIAEGAGTIALELLAGGPAPDVLVVPLGNGSLITGMGAWAKAVAPGTRVVGVCAAGAPAMERSWREGAVRTGAARTIADGIAVRVPVPVALEDMRSTVDEVVLVEDEQILAAMRLAHRTLGLVVEPAGAAGLAAVLDHAGRWAGSRVATPLCGGNVAPEMLGPWLHGPAG